MARLAGLFLIVFAAFIRPTVASASTVTYKIYVTVDSAPNLGGLTSSSPIYAFGSFPTTFVGSFDADNDVAGSITNLALTIGGVDIASTFDSYFYSLFDPHTFNLVLSAQFFGGFQENVALGSSGGLLGTSPANYAVGLMNCNCGPIDPYFGGSNTQMWVGSFVVGPSSVPESTSLQFLLLGAVALLARRRSIQRMGSKFPRTSES